MSGIRVIHWRAAEADRLLETCRKSGREVDYLEGDGSAVTRAIRAKVPDVIVIDLSRRPSHGREVAIWLRNAKTTRDVPIVFVGGDPEKVTGVRATLPDAEFCEIGQVGAAIKRLSKSARQRDLMTPPAMMQRYREKSAAQKLGIESGSVVSVVEPPREFPELLGELPESVEFQEEPAPVTLWFLHQREDLLASLRRMRMAAGNTRLWLLWRKGSGREITQNTLREATREVGLVDYKICSVDQRWSAMLFARKKA